MDTVTLDERHGFARIVINRPAQRNAVNRAARQGLMRRLDEIRDRFSVAVITGEGESFCAGIDLKEEHADRERGVDTARQEWIDTLLAIRAHPAIVIAAVNGYALGGGMSLINVSDLAIAAHEAQLGMPELGFAAYPGMAGPSTQLVLSRKRAAWMVLTARRIDGRTAEAWGLVNASVPRASLDAEVEALASHVAQFDPVALHASKRALDVIPAAISDWPQAFAHGLEVNDRIRALTGAQLDGVARFTHGKRNPGQGGT